MGLKQTAGGLSKQEHIKRLWTLIQYGFDHTVEHHPAWFTAPPQTIAADYVLCKELEMVKGQQDAGL
jgi:hypothetical protein